MLDYMLKYLDYTDEESLSDSVSKRDRTGDFAPNLECVDVGRKEAAGKLPKMSEISE